MRFSILTLLGLVAFAAAACTALRYPFAFTREISYTVEIGILVLAVLLAVFDRSPKRPFWIGYAIIGCAYSSQELIARDDLVTFRIAWYLYGRVEPLELQKEAEVKGQWTDDSQERVEKQWYDEVASGGGYYTRSGNFVSIFQSIQSIVLAFFGGLLSLYIHRRAERQKQEAGVAEQSR